MKKFLVIYHAPAEAMEMMANASPEEKAEGMKPWMEIPPLSWHGGKLTVFYQRQYIESGQRFDGAPKAPCNVR